MLILEIKIAKRLKMRYIFLLAFIIAAAYSAKIKDLASVIGVRENQVIGYGLVVGLSGTGDGSSSKFTIAKQPRTTYTTRSSYQINVALKLDFQAS